MPISRKLLALGLLPVFAACSVYKGKPVDPIAQQTRMQGEVIQQGGQLWFQGCGEARRFIIAPGETNIVEDSRELLGGGQRTLFADLRGKLGSSQASGADGELTLGRIYRLKVEGSTCNDLNFKRSIVHASGNEPFWYVMVNNQGMELSIPDQEPLALPYMEEQLPEGRLNLTSEANGQRVELWIAPQRCVDNMSGNISHLSAELRFNGELMRGCAWFGGARSD